MAPSWATYQLLVSMSVFHVRACISDSNHPTDIEAEVRYAVRHEYAQTAIDFIARRCRLSFLNAQAALEALPHVVDVMAEELTWSAARKREELRRGVRFLKSMGLRGVPHNALDPIGWAEWIGNKLTRRTPLPIATRYSRAQFEAGELDHIRAAFLARATSWHNGEERTGGEKRLHRNQLQEMLSEMPGYEETKPQHLDNVLVEIGFEGRNDIALDEFLEVSLLVSASVIGSLKCAQDLRWA